MIDAEHDHAAVAGDVGEPAAEGEEGREREQVAVDDPLHPGGGEGEVFLDLGSAIATIVWSMKVIETAKIIAARISLLFLPLVSFMRCDV